MLRIASFQLDDGGVGEGTVLHAHGVADGHPELAPGLHQRLPLGIALKVPAMATGTIGSPASKRMRRPPVRNAPIEPSWLRVPSGKIKMGQGRPSATAFMMARRESTPRLRSMSTPRKVVADHRHGDELSLGDEAERGRELGEEHRPVEVAGVRAGDRVALQTAHPLPAAQTSTSSSRCESRRRARS